MSPVLRASRNLNWLYLQSVRVDDYQEIRIPPVSLFERVPSTRSAWVSISTRNPGVSFRGWLRKSSNVNSRPALYRR